MVTKPSYQELEKQIKELQIQLKKSISRENAMLIMQQRLSSLWNLSKMFQKEFKEICNTVLEEIVAVTESQYGFFGFIDANESQMAIYSWSKSVMGDCTIYDKPLIFSIKDSGIWGNSIRERKPLIYNDYNMAVDNKKGIPKGHVKIKRILSVPVFSINGKIVALGCVANKERNYNNNDKKQLVAYLNNIYLILETRKTEEERKQLLKQSLAELKILKGILPLCSFCKKIRNDKGDWENVDIYIHTHSDADISHSICPECMRKNYPDVFEEMEQEKQNS